MQARGSLLIVDDEEEIVAMLTEYFAGKGYSIEAALNGGDALMLAGLNPPDAVILDIRLPDTDGGEVLRRLRELDEAMPVVMLSGSDDQALARRLLKEGAFDYVRKPFDFEGLETIVSVAVAIGREKPRRGVVLPFARERRDPADGDTAPASGLACAVCCRSIEDQARTVMQQGELMHASCWRRQLASR